MVTSENPASLVPFFTSLFLPLKQTFKKQRETIQYIKRLTLLFKYMDSGVIISILQVGCIQWTKGFSAWSACSTSGHRAWETPMAAVGCSTHCSLPSFQNQLKVNGGEEAGFGGQGTDKTPTKRSASSCLLHGWVSRLNWLHFFFFFLLKTVLSSKNKKNSPTCDSY